MVEDCFHECLRMNADRETATVRKSEYKHLKRADYFPVSKALKVLNAALDLNLCLIALFKIYLPVHQFPNHQL